MNEQPNNQPENKKEQVIWEEKNYIELPKNSEPQELLDKKDITPGTKNESMPKLCENTGKVRRKCNKCGIEKSIDDFSKDKHRKCGCVSTCKTCTNTDQSEKRKLHKLKNQISPEDEIKRNEERKLRRKERMAVWRLKNKTRISAQDKEYHEKNREKLNTSKREYYRKNREKILKRTGKYQKKNRVSCNKNVRRRQKYDIIFRLSTNLRGRFKSALKNNWKCGSAVRDLGCSVEYFKHYIAGKFIPGMSWENYGKVWHLDHIIPLSSFDLTNREELLKACHYTNYQPLWATTKIARAHGDMISIGNLEKGDKIMPSL